MKKLRVAAIQLASGNNKAKNLSKVEKLITQAAKCEAKFIVLPEVFNFRGGPDETSKASETIPGYSTNFVANLAKKYKAWILIGSLMEKEAEKQRNREAKKPFNTSILLNPKGKIAAKYRKIHLFDIRLGKKEIFESKRNTPGKLPKMVKVNGAKVGLSICYDLRFPELYRFYAKKGAEIVCVPSSFTKPTGEAHWHTLVRSRAIENLCYVIAPNQFGIGSNNVETFGHSLIVDPWGKVLAEGPPNKEAVLVVDIDLDYLKEIRKNLPALEHRKL